MRNSAFRRSALNISVTALSASLICICSWIALPIGGVPMTLQTFGVAFCGFLLGARGGVSAVAVYLALGAVGLPVFAGFGGSLAFLVGPTGGFLIGFLPLAFFCAISYRTKKRRIAADGCSPIDVSHASKRYKRRDRFCAISYRIKMETAVGAILFPLAGLILCHLLGILWFAYVSGVSPVRAFLLASLPYILKDTLSVFLAAMLCKKVGKGIPHSY